jgi:serine/threonine-protein kinase
LAILGAGQLAAGPAGGKDNPRSATLPAPGPASAGGMRYRKVKSHARGGLGEVFVAADDELQRPIALKEIQPRFADDVGSRKRFVQEALVTGRLEHPGIVPVYGLGAYPDGRPYYAMRFIRGESFDKAIERFHAAEKPWRDPGERSLALRELLRRFIDVCNAIAYAHSKGVLHRDLKPANVMLGHFGETLVVDWGLAKLLREAEGQAAESGILAPSGAIAATQDGAVVGTAGYMSPEQAAGRHRELTAAADVYSLGAILYTLLTGHGAFENTPNVFALLGRVGKGAFAPPREVNRAVPRPLEAVCLKAMALAPEARYASAKALAADVEHWLADEPATAYAEPFRVRVRRWGRRHRTMVVSAAVLLVTATAALAVGLGLVDAERKQTAKANAELTAALARETKIKGELETAKGELETALEQSRKAEKSATEQRKLALETMRAVRAKIDGHLKGKPDLQNLRKELLEQAKDGLEKVTRAADTAGQIDHEIVSVHIELGDILLIIDGTTREAKAQFELAHQLAQKLVAADPGNATAQRDLSDSCDRIGEVQHLEGDLEGALASYQESQKIRQRLADADPTDPTAQHALAAALARIGDVQHARGDFERALTSYQECLKISQKRAAADPGSAQAQRDLYLSHDKVGDAKRGQGDLKGALASYQEGHKISQKRAAAEPGSTEAQHDLCVAFDNLGHVHRERLDLKEAMASYQDGLKIRQKLAAADPGNAQAQRELSLSISYIGDVQRLERDLKGALASYQESLKIRQKLADADPGNPQAQRDLSITFDRVGLAQQAQGDLKGALASFQEYHKISQKLAAANPGNAKNQRNLLISLSRIGEIAEQESDFEKAIEWYQKALDVPRGSARPEYFARDVTLAEARLRICRAQLAGADATSALLNVAITEYVRKKEPDKAIAAADQLVERAKKPEHIYNAARGYALCVPLAGSPEAKEKYAARAVALLKQAVARGYKDVARVKTDTDLDALRDRDDFKALLKELDSR